MREAITSIIFSDPFCQSSNLIGQYNIIARGIRDQSMILMRLLGVAHGGRSIDHKVKCG